MAANKIQCILISKISVGFVDHQHARYPSSQVNNILTAEGEAKRRIGVSKKEELPLVALRKIGQFILIGEAERLNPCSLDFRQSCIVGVGGIDIGDLVTLVGKGPDKVVE